MRIRHLALLSALTLMAPTAVLGASAPADASARDQWGTGGAQSQAYREGYDRGLRAGEEDSRRNQSFNFTDESDYRNADAGYRSAYGNRTIYRDQFRRGYADGYQAGYARYRDQYDTGRGGWGRRGGGPPPWANGRGAGPNGAYRTDQAFVTGYNDGYERGLDDGEDRRRNNPVAESRYRDGDRGYRREYGSLEVYKIRYREGFLQGYTRGHQDGLRYGGRRWWPFS